MANDQVSQAGVVVASEPSSPTVQISQAGVVIVTRASGFIYAEGCSFGAGGESEVIPVRGDRSAWNTDDDYDERHAKDIDDGELRRHLPAPAAAGNYARDDGLKWIVQSGIPLADLLNYARGVVIRGGAADWEAYAAEANRQVLIGDGTDLISRALQNADLPDPRSFTAASELTISGGAITATQTYHKVDTEADAASDDLDTINGGAAGDLLIIRAENDARTVVVKHNTGNIWIIGEQDVSLEDTEDHLWLIYDGSTWCSVGDGGGGAVDAGDVSFTPTTNADWDGDADPGDTDDALDQLAERVDDNEIEIAALPSAPVEMIFSQVVDVEVVNTTTETTLLGAGRGSKTIPADIFDVGTTLRIRMFGYISGSGTPTINIAASAGGTELCSTGAVSIPGSVTDADWHITVDLTCRSTGATGKFVASGLFEHDEDIVVGMVNTSEITLDTTSALEIDVTNQWGTADAGNSMTNQQTTFELMKADDLAVAAPSELSATETV